MIGVETSEPNTPPFVIVNVPPVRSSIVSLPSRARLATAAMSREMSSMPFRSASLSSARRAPPPTRPRCPCSRSACRRSSRRRSARSPSGYALSAMHAAFTKNGMNDSLTPCSFSTRSLQPLAHRDHGGHVDLVERREVRRRVLRLEQMLGDALAARRHLLARLASALRCGRASRARRGRGRRCARCDWRGLGAGAGADAAAGAGRRSRLDHVRLAHDAAAPVPATCARDRRPCRRRRAARRETLRRCA